MAWTTFPTLTDGQVLTGAHMQLVRDNFAETAPAKATTAGRIFVATAANSIAERAITGATVATSETTTGTSYGNLATVGPTVTVTTGTQAIVAFGALVASDTAGARSLSSFAVSSASTIAAADTNSLAMDENSAGRIIGASRIHLQTGLTSGSNIFTQQYRVSANTGTFSNRTLFVIAL
jgi:hypothetical protein